MLEERELHLLGTDMPPIGPALSPSEVSEIVSSPMAIDRLLEHPQRCADPGVEDQRPRPRGPLIACGSHELGIERLSPPRQVAMAALEMTPGTADVVA
jgi:hypothetical protein